MLRYLAGAAIKPGGWQYRLARDVVVGRPDYSRRPTRSTRTQPERRPVMPNALHPPIVATWTMNKGEFLIKGHVNEIEPGNWVTVMSQKPGRDGSRLSLMRITEVVEELGPDEYTGEPMRIARFVRA